MISSTSREQRMSVNKSRLSNQVLREVSKFYGKVKSIYEETGYSKKYPLSPIWESNVKELLDMIHGCSDPIAMIHGAHNTFMFSVNTPNEDIKNRMVDWYIDYLHRRGVSLKSFGSHVQESPYSNQRNNVLREGRLLAPDFLRTLILCLEIKKYCKLPGVKFNVLELGAGYGGLARTLKLFYPDISYAIIDIPESICFSSIFLRLNFPDARFCYVTDPSCLEKPVSEYDFVFVPTMFAEELIGDSFTLFCNTASLGEMKNSVILYWMDFVQNKVDVKYFFGLNRFLNTIMPWVYNFRLNENRCSVSFDAKWRILQWELEPPFTRCPYLETTATRNLEIIAERLSEKSVDRRKNEMRSRQLIQDVAKQDWFVYYDADNSLMLRDNILAPDLSMKGTLFALWESIRLDPNPVNVSMMLKYLNTLIRGKPFEEMFYYQDLFDSLTNGQSGDLLDSLAMQYRDPRLHARFRDYRKDSSPDSLHLSIRSLVHRITTPATRRLLWRLYFGS